MPDTENHLHSRILFNVMYSDAFCLSDVQEFVSATHLKPMKKKREKIETVRSYFPDTWIWELIAVGLVLYS